MTQSHDSTIWLETAAGEAWLTKCIEMRAPRHTFSRAECDSIIAMVLGRQAIPLPGTPAKCNERRPRRPTLASIAKQANKAAIPVARYEVKPDGTVVVVAGTPEQQQGNEVDEWIAKHACAPEKH
jgi:hypothetical protein